MRSFTWRSVTISISKGFANNMQPIIVFEWLALVLAACSFHSIFNGLLLNICTIILVLFMVQHVVIQINNTYFHEFVVFLTLFTILVNMHL